MSSCFFKNNLMRIEKNAGYLWEMGTITYYFIFAYFFALKFIK